MFEKRGGEALTAVPGSGGGPLPADPEALLEVIEACEREVARLQARQLEAMAALQRARAGTPLAEFAADEVSLAIRVSPNAARDRLWVAGALTTRLPATMAALESGELDYYRARCVVEATARLTDQEQVGVVEARVLPRAGEHTATQLRAALRRAVGRVRWSV